MGILVDYTTLLLFGDVIGLHERWQVYALATKQLEALVVDLINFEDVFQVHIQGFCELTRALVLPCLIMKEMVLINGSS